MGKTVHVSPLRYKLKRLLREHRGSSGGALEDFLVRVANARGARVVIGTPEKGSAAFVPSESALSNEELVVAICQLNCLDRPQMLRLAAQLVSRNQLDLRKLVRLVTMERAEPVLAEMSRQALKIAPQHAAWRVIHDRFGHFPPLRDKLLHWTRLAEPVMEHGRPNASGWRLVA